MVENGAVGEHKHCIAVQLVDLVQMARHTLAGAALVEHMHYSVEAPVELAGLVPKLSMDLLESTLSCCIHLQTRGVDLLGIGMLLLPVLEDASRYFVVDVPSEAA
jgi:hypothetical protein